MRPGSSCMRGRRAAGARLSAAGRGCLLASCAQPAGTRPGVERQVPRKTCIAGKGGGRGPQGARKGGGPGHLSARHSMLTRMEAASRRRIAVSCHAWRHVAPQRARRRCRGACRGGGGPAPTRPKLPWPMRRWMLTSCQATVQRRMLGGMCGRPLPARAAEGRLLSWVLMKVSSGSCLLGVQAAHGVWGVCGVGCKAAGRGHLAPVPGASARQGNRMARGSSCPPLRLVRA